MTKKLAFMVAAALCLTLTGCKESGDTDEPSDGTGGGGGGGGTVTLPACTLPATGGSSSGDPTSARGAYKDVAIGSTINSVTLYFAAGGTGAATGSQTINIQARHCGYDNAQAVAGTASGTLTMLTTTGGFKPATFTFSSPIAMNTNCGSGTDRITFKVTSVSGANVSASNVYLGIVQSGNLACTMKWSSDNTSATPTQFSTYEAIGSIQ